MGLPRRARLNPIGFNLSALRANFAIAKSGFITVLLLCSVFLAPHLSYALDEINSIEYISLKRIKKDRLEFSLKTTRPAQILSTSTDNPPAIKIEFKNSPSYSVKEPILLEKDSPIERMKLLTKSSGAVKNRVLVSHVILELKRPLAYEVIKRHNILTLSLSEKPAPDRRKKKEIEGVQKKKRLEDSPEREVERDFIEFIKKARIRWQKEEEAIKSLLSHIEREKYLEEKRLKAQIKKEEKIKDKKKNPKNKKLDTKEEAGIKKKEERRRQGELTPKDSHAEKNKEPRADIKSNPKSEEDLGVILITKIDDSSSSGKNFPGSVKKKASGVENTRKKYPAQEPIGVKTDRLEELSKKEEELKKLIEENENKLENLLKEKENLAPPKKEDVQNVKARELRDKAYIYLMDNKIDSAIKYYRQAIRMDPKYSIPHNDLGIIYEEKGFLEKAEQEYKKAIELDPDYAGAYSNLALLYEKQGKLSLSLPCWQKRVSLGDSDDPWRERALERLDEYKKAGIN